MHKLAQLRYRSASMLTGPVSFAGLLQSAKPHNSAAGCICASSIRQQPAYIQDQLITLESSLCQGEEEGQSCGPAAVRPAAAGSDGRVGAAAGTI